MMTRLISQVQGLARARIAVLGDMILDRYIWGKVDRISPEAPVQVLNVGNEEIRLGGAANVGRNLRALGARVELSGVIGRDPFARSFLKLARGARMGSRGLVRDGSRPTISKTRMMAHNQQMLRVDRERAEPISEKIRRSLGAKIQRATEGADLVIISDYNKGTLPDSIAADTIRACRRRRIPVLVGLKGRDHLKYKGATGATLNRSELRTLSGHEGVDRGARHLLKHLGLELLVVTLGEEGLVVYSKGARPVRLPTEARQVFDVSGAGDTVLAAFGLARVSGHSLGDCARIANAAAGVVVGKVGTAVVTREEIVERLRSGGSVTDTKILAEGDITRVLDRERRKGRRICFTNGCFDVLHIGHVKLLQFARAQADLLVVGLNSDASVRRLKGSKRPIVDQKERAMLLSAMEACDYVVIFNEKIPDRIVRKIKPDVLVKGEDWMNRRIVGSNTVSKRGGRVALAPIFPGKSSSGIIERILERYNDGPANGR